jgi:hypothetical protein
VQEHIPLAKGRRKFDTTCSVTDCGKSMYQSGYCSGHYDRLKRYGEIFPEIPLGSWGLKHKSRIGEPDCEHKDRERYAKGLCKACYDASANEKNKASQKKFRDKQPKEYNFIRKLKYSFDLTLEKYNEMLIAQDYKCAICLTDKPNT